MGSESSGDSGTSLAEETDYLTKQRRKRQEEKRVSIAEQEDQQSYYVRGGGNVVRSSDGTAVTTSAGAKVVDDIRSQQVEQELGSQKKSIAEAQLEQRLSGTFMPGTLGIIQRKNIEKQLADLRAGGAPQFRRTSTGRYVATSVNRPGQPSDSSPNIANSPAYSIGGEGDAGGVARRAVASQQTQTTASDVSGGTARKLLGQSASGVKRRKIYEFGR